MLQSTRMIDGSHGQSEHGRIATNQRARKTLPVALAPVIWAAWAAGLAPGCFFTTPINQAPEIKIERQAPLEAPLRGEQMTFTARNSRDPDGDALVINWTAWGCDAERLDCGTRSIARADNLAADALFELVVPARNSNNVLVEMVLVQAEAVDRRGAGRTTEERVDVLNQNPGFTLQEQAPVAQSGQGGYPIGIPVSILLGPQGGSVQDGVWTDAEGETWTVAWSCYDPAGAPCGERFIPPPPEDILAPGTLHADVPGQWQISATATDEVGGTGTDDLSVLIQEDMPPCVGATEPAAQVAGRYIMDRAGAPRRLAVLTVNDDLDVYPPPASEYMGTAKFRWLVATPDTSQAFVEVRDRQVADYVVDAAAFAPGDIVEVRVEIADRQTRVVACPADAPTCASDGGACVQRVTWTLEVR